MAIIITPTGFKTKASGKVANTPDKASGLFGTMTKSEARKARKALAAGGKVGLAAARRAA